MTRNGVWIARNADATAVRPFERELDAHRFVQSEGYHLEVLLVPWGEDACTYKPPRTPSVPPPTVYRAGAEANA